MTDSISHKAPPCGQWSFDNSVGECFDDMVSRSIPNYAQTIDILARLASKHCSQTKQTTIVDLGCSNGQALAAVAEIVRTTSRSDVRLIGVDREQHMLDRAKARIGEGLECIVHDLRERLPYRIASARPKVVMLLWTAQFIPIEFRARIFREVRELIDPTGAMIVAEKLRGQTSLFQEAIAYQYREWKLRAGYSEESVDAKARALEGVLVSLSAPESKQMMANEGWAVEEITRYLGFASYYLLPR